MTSNGLYAGETAFVTGAGSNIGRAIALALAAEGAHVIATDIEAEPGATLVGEIEAQGGTATFFAHDLSKPSSARDALAKLGRSIDAISILVHSAAPRRNNQWTVGAVTEDEWDAMATTNVRSGFFIARELGLRMAQRKAQGRMLFITSLHAASPRNLPHYSAAKAGQTMAVQELARFFAPAGIRVNALAPGAIGGGGFKTDVAAMSAKIPMGRMGTAADIAGAAIGLLSNRHFGYVTGTTLVVDGGLALYNWIDAATV